MVFPFTYYLSGITIFLQQTIRPTVHVGLDLFRVHQQQFSCVEELK